MGAGASTLPPTIDKATAQSAAGAQFDEAAFDKAAVDGVVSREAFLAASATHAPPLVKRTPSGKKLSELTGDEVPTTADFTDEAEEHGSSDSEADDEPEEAQPKQEATQQELTLAGGGVTDAAEARTAFITAMRESYKKNGEELMTPDDKRFFHGWAYGDKVVAPNCLWKSDQKPRKDHDAPDWLTASEFEDVADVTDAKIKLLIKLMRLSKHTVVYSGAGISASAVGQAAASGVNKQGWLAKTKAKPTMTHHALAVLSRAGLIHGWVQQNHECVPPRERVNAARVCRIAAAAHLYAPACTVAAASLTICPVHAGLVPAQRIAAKGGLPSGADLRVPRQLVRPVEPSRQVLWLSQGPRVRLDGARDGGG